MCFSSSIVAHNLSCQVFPCHECPIPTGRESCGSVSFTGPSQKLICFRPSLELLYQTPLHPPHPRHLRSHRCPTCLLEPNRQTVRIGAFNTAHNVRDGSD